MANKSETTVSSPNQEKEKKYAPIQHKPCQICGGKATGFHFGVISCEACKSFFRRSLKRKKEPICEKEGHCPTLATDVVGIPCPACRLKRCVQEGMSENAVKKGRYSLDRRAEAILESRQYWNSDNAQNNGIKKEVDSEGNGSATSPSFTSGSSTSGSPRAGPGSESVSPPQVLSPCPKNPSDVLSTDDFFTMFSEVCGNEIPGGSTNAPISTIDNESLSTLLSESDNAQSDPIAKNITTSTHPPNIQPVTQPNTTYNSTSPLGQFTFNIGSTQSQGQIPYPNAINTSPNLLPVSEIKQEFPPQQSCSGYGLPAPSHNPVSPNYVNEVLPQGSQQYTTGTANAFEFQMSGASNYPEDSVPQSRSNPLPLHHSPPVQPVQPMLNPSLMSANKQPEPQDMDALCKLLLSDFKVKDDQDYIIDEIVAAFDRQNFTNKGFLAKVSDQQHKYLEGQKEEEKMFGPMTKLSSHEFIQMYRETGVDLDGRLKIMQQHADVLDGWVKQVMQFYKGIPGFTDLPLKDQMALIKATNQEFARCTYFPYYDVTKGTCVSPLVYGQVFDVEQMKALHAWNTDDLIASWMTVIERLQNLQITDREYTMMTAIFVIEPEECITEKGKEQCRQLAAKLDDAFRHLLKKRLPYEKTDEIMTNIKEIRALLRPISRKYNVEYFTSMKLYSEHCGIKYGELTWQYYEI